MSQFVFRKYGKNPGNINLNTKSREAIFQQIAKGNYQMSQCTQ